MKITLSIYNIQTLKECSSLIDAAILMSCEYAYIYEEGFDLNEAIDYCLSNNIEPIIALQTILLENEIVNAIAFIKKYPNVKFLVSDLGIVQIFRNLNLIENVIYDSPMMLCNSMDLSFFNNLGFDAVSMSNEIPVADIITAYQISKSNIYYQIFGRKLMFYSKRKLLTLYKEYSNTDFSNKNLSLVEEKRSYKIPIIENKNGIFCFRQYHLSLLKEIKTLNFLKYGYFESYGIDTKTIYIVLKIYNSALKDFDNIDKYIDEINQLNLNIEDGFTYIDSSHIKEEA